MVRAHSLFLVASMSQSSSRYAHIDSLRAIAALLVVWMHTSEIFVKVAAPGISNSLFGIAHTLDFGRIGVVAFFAVSGFVIPSSLSGDRLSGSLSFAIKRFFRLYPLYWLSIPFGLLTTWYLWGKEISLATILWNLTMVQEALGFTSVQGQYWTLQTELVFYGLCVALFLRGWLQSAYVLSALVMALSALCLLPIALAFIGHTSPFTLSPALSMLALNLGVMFWGALFRIWYDKKPMPTLTRLAVFGFIGVWSAMAVFAVTYYLLVNADIKILHFFVPYALGLAVFAGLAIYGKVKSAWLVWLGTISYSLYLFHPVVFYSLSWLAQIGQVQWLQGWPTGAYMLASLAGTIALSTLTYRYIEQPAMRLGSYLARSSSSRSASRMALAHSRTAL